MSTEVKLIEGTAFKLEPGKKYLFIFDSDTITKENLKILANNLLTENIKGVFLYLNGDPKLVQIIEDNRKATEEKDATPTPKA